MVRPRPQRRSTDADPVEEPTPQPRRTGQKPHQSGDLEHELGISRAGNRWVRGLAIEIAWGWLRHQPDSALTHWYNERFARGRPRARKIGIVALARKLLVALWRYVETGALPEGAVLKP